MKFNLAKIKTRIRQHNKYLFLCQVKDDNILLIKCALLNGTNRQFLSFTQGSLKELPKLLKKLEYNNERVILTLDRIQATCRSLKVPAQSTQEIEKIISLQASRYLPYPANELITGYQVVSTDDKGYSQVVLTVAHKEVIERYLRLLNGVGVNDIQIALNTYGILNLYKRVLPEEAGVSMLLNISNGDAEVAFVRQDKLIYSRAFKINTEQNFEKAIVDELNKTNSAYLKETQEKSATQIILLGTDETTRQLAVTLGVGLNLAVKTVDYLNKIEITPKFSEEIRGSESLISGLMGLGLELLPDSLNLIPQSIKEKQKKMQLSKKYTQKGLIILVIFFIFMGGLSLNLFNKSRYLNRLKSDLAKIEKEARPLEDIEARFSLQRERLKHKPSCLDMLYEVNQVMPPEIYLTNFSYEENNQLLLRGQAPELSYILAFVSNLEKSTVFRKFNIKVRYASKRSVQAQETIDFEIECGRR